MITPVQRDRQLLAFSKQPWPQSAMEILADDACPYSSDWRLINDRVPFRNLSVLDESGRRIGEPLNVDAEKDDESQPRADRQASDNSLGDQSDASDEDKRSAGQEHHHWEALLRFPNAPIYTTHVAKPPMYRFTEEDTWENYHTMRILGAGQRPGARIQHVYLLHNGLNETRDITFHYRLAAWILNRREDAICIIRPLPGHLTRFPFDGFFSETPLDGYLRDPMDLFRQFLRYALETQWLLSTLVLHPRATDVVAGGRLLEHDTCGNAKACGDSLAEHIGEEWDAAFDFNEFTKEKAEDANRPQYSRDQPSRDGLREVVANLRFILGREHDQAEADEPSVHTVGYSMGGFMAQAVFFAWPQVVSSCTSLFAGGALRDLAPTDFANPEEWQTVLHALRYEFDSALADGLLIPPTSGDEHTRIAGLVPQDFRYFKRAFYEVFLQYYRGGYSSRLTEFSRRLLCVLGGDDPIVRTENVLDAGPPEGMTLFQIADLSHFPGGATRKDPDRKKIEREQRMFWMPEIGRIIAQFSTQTESAPSDSSYRPFKNTPRVPTAMQTSREFPLAGEPLKHQAFEKTLDAIIHLTSESADGSKGWLLVSRNEIPPVFLGQRGFRTHAGALHHSEELILRYVRDLEARASRLEAIANRATILIPKSSQEWFMEPDLRQKLFSRSETPGAANLPSGDELREMYHQFVQTWYDEGTIYLVPGGEYPVGNMGTIGLAEAGKLEVNTLSLTMLPDVWIGMTGNFCAGLRGKRGNDDRVTHEQAIIEWITKLSEEDEDTKRDLANDVERHEIVGLKVSAAEFNPRYRGHTLPASALERALRHWALAYKTATPATIDEEATVVSIR
jgi:hypothetical protein